jgi:hypothetical protein
MIYGMRNDKNNKPSTLAKKGKDALRKTGFNRHAYFPGTRKRVISLLLIVSMMLAVLSPVSVSAEGAPMPDTGWYFTNPGADSFVITTAAQLAGLAVIVNNGTDNFAGKTIILGSNIDLIAFGSSHDGGQGWMPIGRQALPSNRTFNGVFNGNGYTVRNLYVNRPSYNGLFGIIYAGSVINLGIENANIRSGFVAGSLAGEITQTVIMNSYATGSVIGSGNFGSVIGGLIGNATEGSVITNCYFSGTVEGVTFVGGLVGSSGENNFDDGVMISNSYSSASVIGTHTVGGLMGSAVTSHKGGIRNSAALNPLVQGGHPAGRIIGIDNDNHTLFGNVALDSMSHGSGGAFTGNDDHSCNEGADVSLEQILSRAFWTTSTAYWTAWDTNIWHIVDGALPTLIRNSVPVTTPGSLTLIAGTAEGEPGDEVEIKVFLEGNYGIAGFDLTLVYNSAILTPLSVIRNPALGGSVFISNVNEIADKSTLGGVVTAVWAAHYDVSVEELFTIRFLINDTLTGDDDIITPVQVYIQDMKYLTRQDVAAARQNGSVTILLDTGNPGGCDGTTTCDCDDCKNKDLWGDVNVDGVVDIFDLIRFARFLAAIPAAELTDRGYYLADVDRNGKVDLGDLILLTRYLQSADPNNPDVILGVPQ